MMELTGDQNHSLLCSHSFRALASKKAAIAFTYDTSDPLPAPVTGKSKAAEVSDDEPDDDFETVDLGEFCLEVLSNIVIVVVIAA